MRAGAHVYESMCLRVRTGSFVMDYIGCVFAKPDVSTSILYTKCIPMVCLLDMHTHAQVMYTRLWIVVYV